MGSMLRNWKTGLAGLITIIAAGLSADPTFAPYTTVIGMISSGVIGLLAKDKAVTGGTISAVDGVKLATPVSLVDQKLGVRL